MAKGDAPRSVISGHFSEGTPTSIGRARGNIGALTQISAIEARTHQVKERARGHFNKYVETWVSKEAMTIWQRRAGLSKETVPQGELAKQFIVNGVMSEARRNVHARMTVRLSKINGIRTRMSNTVIRNMQTLEPMQARGLAPGGEGGPKKGSPSQ